MLYYSKLNYNIIETILFFMWDIESNILKIENLKNEITYDEGEFSLVYKDNNLFIDFFNKSYINYTLNNVIYDLTKNYEMFSILHESGNIFSLLGVVLEHDYMLKQRIQYKQIMDKPFDPKKPYLYNDFMTFLTTEKAWIYEDELYLLDKDNNKKLYIENLNNIKEALWKNWKNTNKEECLLKKNKERVGRLLLKNKNA